MKEYKISQEDMNTHFFHFTRQKNLKSIQNQGLIPKIGIHALTLEKTKKVFFVEGLDHLLILFDCWMYVCSVYPLIPGLFNLGVILIRHQWFPEAIVNVYFKYMRYNKIHKIIAYKYFDRFLKRYVLLNLNIKEGVDFSFEDIDQIKARGYKKEYLIKGGYSLKYSDLETVKMDKWNLHTFSNHGIDSSKLKICYVEDSYKMYDILSYALKNTNLDIENICPVLFDYLKSRNFIQVTE